MAVPYITAADVRAAVTGLDDESKFPDATLERFIARFEDIAERYRGIAYTPREAAVILTSTGNVLLSPYPATTSVTSLAYEFGDAPDADTVMIRDGYRLVLADRGVWPCGQEITAEIVHGEAVTPPAIVDACIEFVRAEALQQKGSQPRNVTGERTDLGWIPEATANWNEGRPTRWVIVNEALNQMPDHRLPGLA